MWNVMLDTAFDQKVSGRSSPGMNPHDLIASHGAPLIQTSWESHIFCPLPLRQALYWHLCFQKSPLTTALPTETYEGIGANFSEQSWRLRQTVLSVSICSHVRTNNAPCFFADRPISQGNQHTRSGAAQSCGEGAANPPLATPSD